MNPNPNRNPFHHSPRDSTAAAAVAHNSHIHRPAGARRPSIAADYNYRCHTPPDYKSFPAAATTATDIDPLAVVVAAGMHTDHRE